MRHYKKFKSYDFSIFRNPMYQYSKKAKENLLQKPLVALMFLLFTFMPENHPEPEHVKKDWQETEAEKKNLLEAMDELQLFAMRTLHHFNTKIYLELYLLDRFGEKANRAFDKVREVPKLEDSSSNSNSKNGVVPQVIELALRSEDDAQDASNDDTMEMGSFNDSESEAGDLVDIVTELSII